MIPPIARFRRSHARHSVRALLLVAMTAAAASAQIRPPYAAADVQYGSRVYGAQCTVCHGPTGETVAGVNLRSGRFRRATTDAELTAIIRTGIPGTAMPAFNFTTPELTGIVAYLRNMRDFNAAGVPVGDPERGHALFDGRARCAECHRVHGRGPRLAPDLSEVGATRTADLLQRTILDPLGSLQPVNRSVRAVTRDGRTVTGRRLNEDTYSVQVIDDQEHLVSLAKEDLREYTVLPTSSMPAYKDVLSAPDLADVVAYLLSLKGVQ
jgi:putative heme-binding domain-containing protein